MAGTPNYNTTLIRAQMQARHMDRQGVGDAVELRSRYVPLPEIPFILLLAVIHVSEPPTIRQSLLQRSKHRRCC
jgi:hypothetical protein